MNWEFDTGNRLTQNEIEAAHAEGLFTDAEYLFYSSEVV